MTYRGTVSGRTVLLDEPVPLADGTAVEVEVRAAPTSPLVPANGDEGATLYDRLKNVVGKAQGLPADAARNKRHYLYGHAKE